MNLNKLDLQDNEAVAEVSLAQTSMDNQESQTAGEIDQVKEFMFKEDWLSRPGLDLSSERIKLTNSCSQGLDLKVDFPHHTKAVPVRTEPNFSANKAKVA